MKMKEVQTMAKAIGIKPKRHRKAELIRKIQTEEGNYPCFQSNVESCDQVDCCWRRDCMVSISS
jgi:predicted metal-binding transcription factor (methanogenesis marker protein 9)